MQKYYYKDHHLYQYYCYLGDQLFKTREEYLDYCDKEGLELKETWIKRKSKYALEWEMLQPGGKIKTTLAKGTWVFDERDLSNYYFQDEEDANNFLVEYGDGNPSFLLEALYSGYEGEPDYSPETAVENLLRDIEVENFDPTKEFKRVAHYIISYLPDNEEDKLARKQAHLNQIKSIKAVSPNAKIYIVAQNYKDEDYLDDPQIEYYKYDKLGAMKARNTALNLFYNSDYDFCILNDDDVVVAPTQSAINFINELEFTPEKFDGIDVIWSRDMIHHPYQLAETRLLDTYNENWVLEYCEANVWHYAVIRNFKKYYNKEEYQDESVDPTTGVGYDDADFCYYLHSQGYMIWKCFNAIQSYAQNWVLLKNSVVYTEPTNPWIRVNNKKATINKWILNEEGQPDIRYFMNKCNRLDTRRLLARNEVVDTLLEYNQRNAKEFIESYRELRKREAEFIALRVL